MKIFSARKLKLTFKIILTILEQALDFELNFIAFFPTCVTICTFNYQLLGFMRLKFKKRYWSHSLLNVLIFRSLFKRRSQRDYITS